MKELIAEILADYGSEAEIENADGSCAVRAFLQPVTAKSWDNMRRTIQMLGELPQGRYLYIGPADRPLADTDRIRCRGVRYRVCRTEELLLAGEPVYIWGLLQRDGGDDPWSC